MTTELLNNQIELSRVWFKDRIRTESYGDLEELAMDIRDNGQLQDILIRNPNPDEQKIIDSNPKMKDVEYVLVEGGRRFIAIEFLHKQKIPVPDLPPGTIGVKFKGSVESRVKAVIMEYRANDLREDFTWRERAGYVRRIHSMCSATNEKWVVADTAETLRMSEATVYKYLELTANKEILEDERVAKADSFRTAYKQYQILREHQKRALTVEHREKRERAKKQKKEELVASGVSVEELEEREDLIEISDFSTYLCQQGDCREWIRQFPDNSFDYFHWDPPYGGEQGGGAFTSYTRIDDSYDNAMDLLATMVPELYRTLRPGRWIAIWCHPAHIQDVGRFLGGHEWSPSTNTCAHCQKPWNSKHLRYYCAAAPNWCFWVNPYPNIWYKVDRGSDAHEIKRFLNNDYETFLFACAMKLGAEDPILCRSDRSNVFTFPVIPKSGRRHVMHKPPDLIEEILSCISIPGEIGCDPSAGSFSSVEAALKSRRKILACDLDEENCLAGAEAVTKVCEEFGVKPYHIDFLL